MNKGKPALWLIFFIAAVFLAGCNQNADLGRIEKNQEEILSRIKAVEEKLNSLDSRMKSVEGGQKQISSLFKKPSRPSVDYDKVHNIPLGDSPVKGDPDAPVTIVEFSDFQCPYCARLQPTLKQVLKAYPDQVKLVFKDFPLSFHKQAMNAARAAHAAGDQGKYWEMHDMIFENFNKLSDDKFTEFAGALKLDVEKFSTDFKSGKYDKKITEAMRLGRKLGVSGTPTLFLNGKRVKRRSFDAFKTAIEGYLKKK